VVVNDFPLRVLGTLGEYALAYEGTSPTGVNEG
jgi:hypothetical protein